MNSNHNTDLDFTDIAHKIREHQEKDKKSKNDGYVKMTIYVREDIANAFSALTTKQGQQKEFINEAMADFIKKKIIELGLDN